ncbi:uncharacterized protein LOC107270083 isoform X2 [Cephus cinctus]|uniref:Uncharacterized protein LOC107270083 isoform X2 n=1 Tax=Cephus cinctus TaxID=211228 RepID=A0AAJ7C271_CEPCN|nr:uncharacterized protein LOC107270083 isoform X2 [Cephus cinctus]
MDLNLDRTCTIRKNLRDLYTTMSLMLLVILCGTLVGIDASDQKCRFMEPNVTSSLEYVCIEADISNLEVLPSNVEFIEFSVSRFEIISPDTFSRFSRLKKLNFYNCDIQYIDPAAFRGLNNLEFLVIYNSNIGVVHASSFQYLPNLRNLALKRTKIVYVMPGAFSGLIKLTTLNLHDNDLNCLPIDLFSDLPSLKSVQIDSNPWLCSCLEDLESFFKKKDINMIYEKPSSSHRNECMTEVKLKNHGKFFPGNQSEPGTIIASSGDVGNSLSFLFSLEDDIRWISASAISVKRIPPYTFFRFGSSLRSLEFRNCNITEIEDGAFAGLAKLKRLVLIVNIENGSFSSLGKLRHLSLINTKLQCLSKDELNKLVNLQTLNVTSKTWDCECRTDLNNYLMDRRIRYKINNFGCPLRPLATNEIGELRKITKRHQTHEIHKETVRNTSVVFRNGSVSKTTTAVQTIQETPRLDFDDEVLVGNDCCTSCRQVNHDRFTIAYACNRATLEQTNGIPSSIDALEFHSSYIPIITRRSFARFGKNLKMLKFWNCQTENIERDAFLDLVALETLIIQDNNLKSVEEMWFYNLRNLKHLDLSGNKITEIEDGVFSLIPNLVTLKIGNNPMTCINVDSLEGLRHLEFMSIAHNPWTCHCKLRLVQYLEDRRISYENDADQSTCYHSTTRATPSGTAGPPTPGYDPTGPPVPNQCEKVSRKGECTFEEGPEPCRIIKYKCAYGNLFVLDQIPANAESIELTDVCIHNLPPRAFAKFHNLAKLVIRNSRIHVVEPGAFDGLINLKELAIHNSHLKIIESSWYHGRLDSLTRLSLTGNKITKIEDGVFSLLPNLLTFHIDDNSMTYINLHLLDRWRYLQSMRIAKNPWTCPVMLELIRYLEQRKISYDEDKVDESQCWSTITAAPPTVPTDSEFSRCNETTNLVSNHCIQVSRKGECSKYQVSEPDQVIKHRCTYGNLAVLDQIPSDAKYIELDDVCIHHLPRCAFSRFHNLVKLVIRNCRLHVVEPGAFDGLFKLQELTIHNSHLKIIEPSWFHGRLDSLRKLSLTGNKITKIENRVFSLLPNLLTFHIDDNSMTYINLHLLDRWRYLQSMRIAKNPWTCPVMLELIRYLEQRKISYDEDKVDESQCWSTTTAAPPTVPTDSQFSRCNETTNLVSNHCIQVSRKGECSKYQVSEPDQVIKHRCTYGNLAVLDQIPSDAKYIELDDVCIHHLPRCAFSRFHNLVKLVIRNCRLHVVEPGAFDGLFKLQELTIHNSHLKIIESSWFHGRLDSLRKLSLTGNKITKIENRVFSLLPNLLTFHIDDNSMTYISLDLLGSWHYLESMRIAGNPWTCPVMLELIRYLKQLHISYDADKVNESPCLSATTAAPPIVTNNPHFAACNKTKDPASNHCIQFSRKGECTIDKVPEPDQVIKHKCTYGNLTVLDQISSDAKYIELDDVCVHYLPPRAFSKFHNLTKLVIRNCKLHEVDPRAFDGLFNLQELTIDNNQLETINSSWFRDTTQLRNLTLTNNFLTEIPVDIFPEQMKSLEHLSLQGNNLTCVYTNMLTNLSRLKSMEFGDNKLKWRCRTELVDYLDLCYVNYTKMSYNSKTFVRDVFADKLRGSNLSSTNVTSFLKFLAIGLIFLVQCF